MLLLTIIFSLVLLGVLAQDLVDYSEEHPQSTVCIFSMVKNEVDIIESFVLYYGGTFGFKNMHIVDNYSNDGSYEMLVEMQRKFGFHLFQEKNYMKKHVYMQDFVNKNADRCDFAIPIDVDEFIVLCDSEQRTLTTGIRLHAALDQLPRDVSAYSIPTVIMPVTHEKIDFKHIELEARYGAAEIYGRKGIDHYDYSKVILNLSPGVEIPILGHGNHVHELRLSNGGSASSHRLLNLCNLHFHFRNEAQMRKKTIANWGGLGHSTTSLEAVQNTPSGRGFHYKGGMINILQNKSVMVNTPLPPPNERWSLYGFTSGLRWARLGRE